MPYKLLLSEEISPAVRRIALEQLTRARKDLSAAKNIQEGVHRSRKCLKRLRSLMRLARPIIGEEMFKRENRSYRDIGRALARPRDAGALLETLIKFEAREDMERFQPLVQRLKHTIARDKQSFEAELEIIALSHIVETLDASIARWRSLPLAGAEFEDLAHGFAMSYERGRRSLKVALSKNQSFYLHEWRKDVQQTWRHMQILTLIWPEDIMPRIRLAQEISRLMGTEHDLSELLLYMKANKRIFKKDPALKALRKPFRSVIKTIQRDLCLHAAERGRRLYAIEATALSDAMTVYWRTAQAMQPMPGLVRAMAEIETTPLVKLDEMRRVEQQKRLRRNATPGGRAETRAKIELADDAAAAEGDAPSPPPETEEPADKAG